ncbi:D-alanyl-D-alanine carboxypeptidase [Desulfatibacillum alkenivorans DSM 16219]|jgi:D-alanyl-D-alanine carboxypeptidase|uniref:D-alanyl-D-alanine carboxypeptidase n=1 Tax=Desulfatibacillum alkenivorans DSM 16219 TaxID=1121393 RepID=A0A1M7ATC7_9BACT|nr:serine hydrolase domain-containing protein [Desulfatibacillum alkenivorans]SHL45973.1 D-alanyl-D-alanine carboxypeptidase [Desulfatibacillum alkenivorans DSM 16219]
MQKSPKFKIIFLMGIAIFIFSIGCSDDNDLEPYPLPLALQRMVNEVIVQYQAPGAALAIRYADGSTFSYAAGMADLETQTPLTPQHLFRIGSVTKTVTACGVLMLYQQGFFGLDDSVESILPGLIPVDGDQITVRMLLNHTSGLEDYVACPYEGDYFFTAIVDDPTRAWTPEELVQVAVDCGLADTPGQSFLYSNANYIILGLIIETVSGQNYEDFVQDNIFDALGMQNTLSPVQTGFPGDFAHGYFEKDSDGLLYDYSIQSPSAVWAAGNVISTPADLLIWAEALSSGALLTQDAFDQRFIPVNMHVDDHPEATYGLGVLVEGPEEGHNGSVPGYQTQLFAVNGVYFAVYTNCYYQTKNNVSQVIYDKAKEILQVYDEL